jgi:hypothetical protein
VVDNGDTIYCRACSRDDKPVPPPPTTYTKVQIETPEEECPCAECGMPLYVGDDAYERDGADPSLYTYCSPSCGRADEFVIKNPTGGSN